MQVSSDEEQKEERRGIAISFKETSEKVRKKKRVNTWYYMGVAGEIGFSIALPIAIGGIVGSFLDTRWGTYPKMTLSLLFTGIGLSVINFIYVIKTILDKEK